MRHATRQERVRELLADRDWHDMKEMQRAGGFRYGARLFDAHNSAEPLHYELREGSRFGQFFYRQVRARSLCSICRNPHRARLSERIALLEVDNRKLRERLAAGFGGAV